MGRLVHSGSRGFTREGLGIVEFNRVRVGTLGKLSPDSFVFSSVHYREPRGRRVH